MAADPNETRGPKHVQVFDVRMIEDPAEQERLNRALRRPGPPSPAGRWLRVAGIVAAILLAGVLGFLLRGWVLSD